MASGQFRQCGLTTRPMDSLIIFYGAYVRFFEIAETDLFCGAGIGHEACHRIKCNESRSSLTHLYYMGHGAGGPEFGRYEGT